MLDIILAGLAIGQLVLCCASCYPFDLQRKFRSLGLYIPVLSVIIAMFYEWLMGILGYNIRVDLFIVMPVAAFIIGMGSIRWITLILVYAKMVKSSGRMIQLSSTVVIGICCLAWFYRLWN